MDAPQNGTTATVGLVSVLTVLALVAGILLVWFFPMGIDDLVLETLLAGNGTFDNLSANDTIEATTLEADVCLCADLMVSNMMAENISCLMPPDGSMDSKLCVTSNNTITYTLDDQLLGTRHPNGAFEYGLDVSAAGMLSTAFGERTTASGETAFVTGWGEAGTSIDASGSAAVAHVFADNAGDTAVSSGRASMVVGYLGGSPTPAPTMAPTAGPGDGLLEATADASFVFGYALRSGTVSASAEAAFVVGYSEGANSNVSATGIASLAAAYAADENYARASGPASRVFGYVGNDDGLGIGVTKVLEASGRGAGAQGYVGFLSPSPAPVIPIGITAAGDGSLASAYSSASRIVVNGHGAAALCYSEDNSTVSVDGDGGFAQMWTKQGTAVITEQGKGGWIQGYMNAPANAWDVSAEGASIEGYTGPPTPFPNLIPPSQTVAASGRGARVRGLSGADVTAHATGDGSTVAGSVQDGMALAFGSGSYVRVVNTALGAMEPDTRATGDGSTIEGYVAGVTVLATGMGSRVDGVSASGGIILKKHKRDPRTLLPPPSKTAAGLGSYAGGASMGLNVAVAADGDGSSISGNWASVSIEPLNVHAEGDGSRINGWANVGDVRTDSSAHGASITGYVDGGSFPGTLVLASGRAAHISVCLDRVSDIEPVEARASGDGAHIMGFVGGSASIPLLLEASGVGSAVLGTARVSSGSKKRHEQPAKRAYTGTTELSASGDGALVTGLAEEGALQGTGDGALVQGFASGESFIQAGAPGTHAGGCAIGTGGIVASAAGAFAHGEVDAGAILEAAGRGSAVFGSPRAANRVIANAQASMAIGLNAVTGDDADASLALGRGAATHLPNSLAVGTQSGGPLDAGQYYGSQSVLHPQALFLGSVPGGPFTIALPEDPGIGELPAWAGVVTVSGRTFDTAGTALNTGHWAQSFRVMIGHVASTTAWEIIGAVSLGAPIEQGALIGSTAAFVPGATDITITSADSTAGVDQFWAVNWHVVQF